MNNISLMEALAKTAGALKNYTDDATGAGGLESVTIGLDEAAPAETVPSICNFILTPTTMQAAYAMNNNKFWATGVLHGREVPLLTTKGALIIKDVNGEVKYSKRIENLINYRGVSDLMTGKGIHKAWSKKFYLNVLPAEKVFADNFDTTKNVTYTWTFTEADFVNTGVPAKLQDIPIASPCFYNNSDSQNYLNSRVFFAQPFPAKFSYDAETGVYILVARGVYDNIEAQLTNYSKVYFYYPLETPYDQSDGFAMGLSAGDSVSFEDDLSEAQDFVDNAVYKTGGSGTGISEYNIKPVVEIKVPRNTRDALDGMENAAMLLNADGSEGVGDATVQGYSWIGDGDGVTDYTAQIQNKLNELHTIYDGGTIHLGSGTYPISGSLVVYDNTRIIGNGHTIIKQTADNTHAIILSGSNIVMRDLTIKLAGKCTEITSCIYANSNNRANGNRDEKYPENIYVHHCSVNNVKLVGAYDLTWHDDGYQSVSDEAMAHRGVGIYNKYLFFNYFDCGGLICKNLYAGIYNGGGANHYRMYVTHSRMAVYDSGGNNYYEIKGHSLYGENSEGIFGATDYIVYCEEGQNNIFNILGFYDTQYIETSVYFAPKSMSNICYLPSQMTGLMKTGIAPNAKGRNKHEDFRDVGRCNEIVQPLKKTYFTVGNRQIDITGQLNPNANLNPVVDNALAGAGVWGAISSNTEWVNDGISLSEVCRYPKDSLHRNTSLGSAISSTSPSEDRPVEIVIDISDRPICGYYGLWIQFDHRYVAQTMTISFDDQNDGTYRWTQTIYNNVEPIAYQLFSQKSTVTIYRIKISITKALQIPNLEYQSADYVDYTIDYNPNGLVGIVNIGMPQNDACGRAFLGECGGSLYGNVDMHQNTLKNLPAPTDDGDAVSKAYLERRLAELEALIGGK